MLSLRTVVSNPRQALLGQSLIYINLNEGTAPPHFPNAYGMAVKLLWVILMTRYFPRFLLKTMSPRPANCYTFPLLLSCIIPRRTRKTEWRKVSCPRVFHSYSQVTGLWALYH